MLVSWLDCYEEWKAFLTNNLEQVRLLLLYKVSKWKLMHCSISKILMGSLIF